VYKNKTVVFI